MKRAFSLALAVILCLFAFTFAAFAEEGKTTDALEAALPRLVDDAQLLSESEKSELLSLLAEISERQQFDIVIVTKNDSLDGKTVRDYADDFYDYNGYGYSDSNDGVLLLVSMQERDWYISTCGYGIYAITDAGIDYISQQFVSYLSDGDYYKAFTIFAEQTDKFVTQAKNGEPYDNGNLPKDSSEIVLAAVIAAVIGLLLAFIPVTVMKSKLKTVRMQQTASQYQRNNSLVINQSSDSFLYSTVSKRPKPQNNGSSGGSSTHTSSSGTSHGGGGGKF